MDREKVIEEAEAFIKRLAPDDKHKRHIGIMVNLGWIYDVLALLKEQEAVEPKIDEYGEAFCECGENVEIIHNNKQLPSVCMKFCPECGRLLKWTGKQ